VVRVPAESCLRANDWICGAYLRSRKSTILHALAQHVRISAVALALAVILAVPLTLLATRSTFLRGTVLGVAGVVYTIPSLALFVLLQPYFDISSTTPILIALVGYAQLLLLRNVIAGLDGVPDDVVDAARGMGYGNARLFLRVKVPLAMPAIVAGFRVTAVSTIALLTVGGVLDKGGLGQLLFDGYQNELNAQILTALVLIVALALVVDLALQLAQRALLPWARLSR
jgi:osmoprotectant transport system permease protein